MRCGAILPLAPAEMQQDIELVETCVSQHGGALRFVLPELRDNKDIAPWKGLIREKKRENEVITY